MVGTSETLIRKCLFLKVKPRQRQMSSHSRWPAARGSCSRNVCVWASQPSSEGKKKHEIHRCWTCLRLFQGQPAVVSSCLSPFWTNSTTMSHQVKLIIIQKRQIFAFNDSVIPGLDLTSAVFVHYLLAVPWSLDSSALHNCCLSSGSCWGDAEVSLTCWGGCLEACGQCPPVPPVSSTLVPDWASVCAQASAFPPSPHHHRPQPGLHHRSLPIAPPSCPALFTGAVLEEEEEGGLWADGPGGQERREAGRRDERNGFICEQSDL